MLTETIDMFLSPEKYEHFVAFTTGKLKFSDWIELYDMSFYFFFNFIWDFILIEFSSYLICIINLVTPRY